MKLTCSKLIALMAVATTFQFVEGIKVCASCCRRLLGKILRPLAGVMEGFSFVAVHRAPLSTTRSPTRHGVWFHNTHSPWESAVVTCRLVEEVIGCLRFFGNILAVEECDLFQGAPWLTPDLVVGSLMTFIF